MPPVPIEDAVKMELPIVSNAMLIGDQRKFLSMLLTLKVRLGVWLGGGGGLGSGPGRRHARLGHAWGLVTILWDGLLATCTRGGVACGNTLCPAHRPQPRHLTVYCCDRPSVPALPRSRAQSPGCRRTGEGPCFRPWCAGQGPCGVIPPRAPRTTGPAQPGWGPTHR